jgi:DNA polymerase-3 subunit delta
MTPEQFLARLKKNGPEPAYLFLGAEAFERGRCRRALIEAALPDPGERASGLTHHDLDQTPLAVAMDDARSMSLFAPRRVIWLSRAEAAVPRARIFAGAEEEAPEGDASLLAAYVREPAPGTVLVIECSRYDFEGEDKTKLERVGKFFSAVPNVVEFRAYAPEAARALAQRLAKEAGLQLGQAELALLLEATGADAARITIEIEKLRLLAGTQRKVTAGDIRALVADAQAANIFALVSALGRGDRSRALELLNVMAREGEYMPLALTLLGTQFRMALAAREAGLRGAGQIQAHFAKLGMRMWPERARQVEQTAAAFPKARLERAVEKLFQADRALRDARPDDRIVMEEMILELTGS